MLACTLQLAMRRKIFYFGRKKYIESADASTCRKYGHFKGRSVLCLTHGTDASTTLARHVWDVWGSYQILKKILRSFKWWRCVSLEGEKREKLTIAYWTATIMFCLRRHRRDPLK